MERALLCPQCNAPLKAHRFARVAHCPFCGTTVWLDEDTVSAARFHDSYLAWNSPDAPDVISFDNAHWVLEQFLAAGESGDVFAGRRARTPTERVIIKLLRPGASASRFENEWARLVALQDSEAPGYETFTAMLPQPVFHGVVTSGSHAGRPASIFRRESGFRHTLAAVVQAYPGGIPPRASIWVWRRILEMLTFIHASGLVHGAVLPPHLLLQENDHGIRFVGFSRAGRPGDPPPEPPPDFAAWYPAPPAPLQPALDLLLAARTIAVLLGGDPRADSFPAMVPDALAERIRRQLSSPPDRPADAWALRQELGLLAGQVFGAPQFNPIVMPS